jgi:hypothetical protein
LATAFRSEAARTLLTRARRARLEQDSALTSYDAEAYQRLSFGLAFRETGREHDIARDDEVARIQWQRGVGAVVDLLGKRTVIPMSGASNVNDSLPSSASLPIPYFPGRESVWIGGSLAHVTVDERQLVHPIADGAEAYYTYAIGDSITYQLPTGPTILLRELRVEAREPRWNLIVGSFWFDQSSALIVRAVYRMPVEMDVLQTTADEHQRDPTAEDVPFWLKPIISPVKASVQFISVEYGLFEGRFWLPTKQSAEARGQLSLIRVPLTLEERFDYTHINGPVDVAAVMALTPRTESPAASQLRIRDSVRAVTGKENGKLADSIVNARTRAAYDSARRQLNKTCRDLKAKFTRRTLMYDNTLDVVTRIPCDPMTLTNSPDLPTDEQDQSDAVSNKREHEQILSTLNFGLQAGWAPQRMTVSWGLGQSRYNRVEGFSTGILLREELGRGYAWSALLRGSQGDRQFNGELGVARTDGRTTFKASAYRRLVSASDWGDPFSFSASLPSLFAGRDEAFYYRAWGGELMRTSEYHGHVAWRAFAEEEWNAPVTTRFSVFAGRRDKNFIDNVETPFGKYAGASVRWRQNWGASAEGWERIADVRFEGAAGTSAYARSAFDLSVAHTVFGPISASITGAGGSSLGDVPPQRKWFLGGAQTVRGQDAGAATGNAFWFARAEVGRFSHGSRLSVFGDIGWAGSRDADWGRSQRPMAGSGVGTSLFGGLLRFDAASGIWPKEQRRSYFSVDARF